MLGFWQTEELSGEIFFIQRPTDPVPIQFRAKFGVTNWRAYITNGETNIHGNITIKDFATRAPFAGKLTILPVRKKILIYDFDFTSDDGQVYRFYGEKNISWRRPLKTVTTLHVSLFKDELVIARGTMYFPVKNIPAFILSIRPCFTRQEER